MVNKQLHERYTIACRTLSDLGQAIDIIKDDVVGKTYYKHMRKSQIQGFKFSIDTFWKFLKEYLVGVHKVQVEPVTPKKVLRESLQAQIITLHEMEILLQAVDARNSTSHTYHEELAEEIAGQIPQFYEVMKAIVDRLPS